MPLAEHATQVLVTRPGWQVCTRYISGWNLISSQVNLSKNVDSQFPGLLCVGHAASAPDPVVGANAPF